MKMSRLADIQVFVRAVGLTDAERRSANEAFFALFEPVRLWVRENRVAAPFRKLLITVASSSVAAEWDGKASVALGICEVTEAVDVKVLHQSLRSASWLVGVLLKGIQDASAETQWDSGEVVRYIDEIGRAGTPIVHRFGSLARSIGRPPVRCDLLMRFDIGETSIQARIERPGGSTTTTLIVERQGPLYLEDEFPVSFAAVRDGAYVLMDRSRCELARVPLGDEQKP